jgi:hypothetical protein
MFFKILYVFLSIAVLFQAIDWGVALADERYTEATANLAMAIALVAFLFVLGVIERLDKNGTLKNE